MPENTIRYSYSFFDKFSIQSKVGDSNDLILRSRDTNQLILMKEIEVLSSQYEETLATLQYQKRLSHQQLLSLVDYYGQPSINKFMVLYQYCSISLFDQFQNRLIQKRCFQETQLWSIFTSLIFGLAYLQEQNVGHGSISLSDCFLNEQGFIKISDPTCATSNPYTVVKGYFYAPEILRCLVHQTGEEINIFKSDIFALGCCMLQLTLMRDLTNIFDYQNGNINKLSFKYYQNQLQSLNLSKQYTKFIKDILNTDSNERPDFVQIKSQIFKLLSIDPSQQNEPMRQSFQVKSSISSLCRSKGEPNNINISIKEVNRSEQNRGKINESKQTFGKNSIVPSEFGAANKNSKNASACKQNFDKKIQEIEFFKTIPNVDHLFGNLKKSVHLETNEVKSPSTLCIQLSNIQIKTSQVLQTSFVNKNNKNGTQRENLQALEVQENKKCRIKDQKAVQQYKKDIFSSNQTDHTKCSPLISNLQTTTFRLSGAGSNNNSKRMSSEIFSQTPKLLQKKLQKIQETPKNTSSQQVDWKLQNQPRYSLIDYKSQDKPSKLANQSLYSNSNKKNYSNSNMYLYPNAVQNHVAIYESKYEGNYSNYGSSYKENRHTGRKAEEMYTNPDFLKMMQADVKDILTRRKIR